MSAEYDDATALEETRQRNAESINRLLFETVEQRTLAVLLRIETLLRDKFDPVLHEPAPPIEDLITSVEPASTPLMEKLGKKKGRK